MSSFLFMRKYLSLRLKLQNELEFMNKNLEAMVNERTLGLKLCYELVQINKGTMSVESKEGEGSCFSITLPGGPGETIDGILF